MLIPGDVTAKAFQAHDIDPSCLLLQYQLYCLQFPAQLQLEYWKLEASLEQTLIYRRSCTVTLLPLHHRPQVLNQVDMELLLLLEHRCCR